MSDGMRHVAAAIAWLAIVVLIALGAAGLVAATNVPPAAGTRAELTWANDRRLAPELAAATGELAALTDQVDALGAIGRKALVALVDRDVPAVRAASAEGDAQLAKVGAAIDALRARLRAVPGIGPDDAALTGADLRGRYDRLALAISATDGLAASWTALTQGSLAAIDLSTSLSEHDARAAEAGTLGRGGRYQKALAVLDRADAALATSRRLRDRLANTTDVSILSQWIDRNAAFDAAVRRAWTELARSKGKVTAAVRSAFAELRTAEANLPPDGRALVVIMSDVARGGLNQAVIGIEEAKGRLDAAGAALGGE